MLAAQTEAARRIRRAISARVCAAARAESTGRERGAGERGLALSPSFLTLGAMDSGQAPSTDAERAVGRHRGLVARALLVSALTLLSRLLGFVREALMAAVFGDRSVVSDAFLTAWRFPNLFRRLLGEGALSVSLQTAMTRADIQHGDAAGRALFQATLTRTLAILALVSVLGMGLTWVLPDAMPGTGWAWLGPVPAVVRDLTVRVLPYVPLVCAAAVLGGALAVRGHFALPNLAPTAMNLVWIASLVAIGMASSWGRAFAGPLEETLAQEWELARWLAWGVLLGGVVQLGLHCVPLGRFGLLGAPGGVRPDPWQVLRATVPLVFGAAIYQINVMIDGLMANSLLSAGGATVLYYAHRLQQFPLALISTAAVNAVFPLLNAHGHLGERGRVRALHDRAQLGILFLALPAAAGLFALALPIASVCYEHGNFGREGAERVAEALRCLALALVPAGAAGLASRVFVAMDDTRTPVRIAVWMVLLNVGLNTPVRRRSRARRGRPDPRDRADHVDQPALVAGRAAPEARAAAGRARTARAHRAHRPGLAGLRAGRLGRAARPGGRPGCARRAPFDPGAARWPRRGRLRLRPDGAGPRDSRVARGPAAPAEAHGRALTGGCRIFQRQPPAGSPEE